MAHRLHVHIIASSRRVVVGLRVLLMASGLVDRISEQDPHDRTTEGPHQRPDLVILDLASLAPLESPRKVLSQALPSAVPWCAVAHNHTQEAVAADLGASYVLPLGFTPELLFSILAGCLPPVQAPVFRPVPVQTQHLSRAA